MLGIGHSFSKTVIASDKIVQDIAMISGDINPIHLDDEYAKRSIFGKRVAHALFCHNVISMIIGNHLPGNGAILVSQTFNYLKPVYIGDAIETVVTVNKVLSGEKYVLSTICRNQKKEVVLEGESIVKWKKS